MILVIINVLITLITQVTLTILVALMILMIICFIIGIALDTLLIKLTNEILLISSRIVVRPERIGFNLVTLIMINSTLSYV